MRRVFYFLMPIIMVSIVPGIPGIEKPLWEVVWYAKRDRTGEEVIYTIYRKDGFYHFHDGKSIRHEHSIEMWPFVEWFTECDSNGHTPDQGRIRRTVLRALPDVQPGTPQMLRDWTVACATALDLYGEQNPCLPPDTTAAMFRRSA